MNYEEALNYIHSLERFGSQPGLERIKQVLKKLGDPQDGLRFIHLAGTNGKGSTAAFSASILKCCGLKTGLFISPFVVDFRERIQINGEYIGKADLARLAEQTAAAISDDCYLTEFEFITVLAFLYFKEQACDAVVLETGLGGRLDATNVIKKPLVSVITKIGLDHTRVLGDTISLIAAEKCGIIKSGAPVVSVASQPNDALSVIEKFCRERDCRLALAKMLPFSQTNAFESHITVDGVDCRLGLSGSYQAENAAAAVLAAKTAFPQIGAEEIKKGIENARFPARFELISRSPLVLLDGAHNPCGAAALAEALKTAGLSRLVGISGMMADKETDRVLQTLCPFLSAVVCLEVKSNPRSLSAEKLKEKAAKFCCNTVTAENTDDSLTLAENILKSENADGILVFGSLYLASEIREKLKKLFS